MSSLQIPIWKICYLEWSLLDDEAFEDEKRGPPEVDEATLQSLDQAAAVEEIDRLRKVSEIEDHCMYICWQRVWF